MYACLSADQVSEEVERALAKLVPANLNGRYDLTYCSKPLP